MENAQMLVKREDVVKKDISAVENYGNPREWLRMACEGKGKQYARMWRYLRC
jgi:hypothetical protein